MKKFTSILLCVTMFFCSLGLMTTAASEVCIDGSCEFDPIIQIAGGHGALTEHYGTPNEKSYYGVDSVENMKRDLLPKLPGVLASVATVNPSRVVDAVIDMFDAWVGPLAYDAAGNSVKPLWRPNPNEEKEMAQAHDTPEARYTFTFDWRRSPIALAAELNDFVQKIKAHTGHKNVHIQCMSGSGSMLLCYMDKYVNGVSGPDALSIVLGQPTGFGTPMVGHFLNARYEINPRNAGALDFLYALNLDPGTNKNVLAVMNLLYNTGALDALGAASVILPQAAYDRIYEQITRKTYAAWPGMWSWCPPEDFAPARERLVSGTVHGGNKLLGEIDAYYAIQLRAKDILREANGKIKVANMIGYNMALLPIGRKDKGSSDGMVDVTQGSLGAVSAPFGRKLPANYTQAVGCGHRHISPDWKVDASSAALPENTWFLKDAVHQKRYEYGGWYSWWRTAPRGRDTVNDNPDFPQFLQAADKNITGDTGSFVPVTPEAPGGLWDTMMGFWDNLLSLVRGLFDSTALPFKGWIDKIWGIWF